MTENEQADAVVKGLAGVRHGFNDYCTECTKPKNYETYTRGGDSRIFTCLNCCETDSSSWRVASVCWICVDDYKICRGCGGKFVD